MRIALGLAYDGSAYSGWQTQLNQPTVQVELEQAISKFVGEEALKSGPFEWLLQAEQMPAYTP